LEWAEDIEFLEDIAGGDDLTALDNRPVLAPELQFVMELYLALARSRPPSMGGISSITITDIEALYRMHEVGDVMTAEEFIGYVHFLDDVFRGWYRKHQKKRA
jgi:hypothetical protein